VFALSSALIAGGTGVAIAAVTKDDAKKSEQAVLDDAAKRLEVTPQKLRDALAAAQDAQLDQAVKDGDLTQKQADAIKAARKASGTVLGPGLRGGPWMHDGPGPGKVFELRGGPGPRLHHLGVRGDLFDDIAKALGTTKEKIVEQLRDGKSVAEILKANGTSVADVRAAVKAAMTTRLDKAVKAGDLTRKQADEILANVDEKVAAIASGKGPRLRLRAERHHPFGAKPPAGAPRPGAFMPGEQGEQDAPDLAVTDGVIS
jgi:uncharacterized protein (DUF433 family)